MISILAYKQWRINQTLQARDDPRSDSGKYLSIAFEDFRNLASIIYIYIYIQPVVYPSWGGVGIVAPYPLAKSMMFCYRPG